ncbi:MAG TPA: ABC transporter ATP-binding protein [Ignavibacteria bacterium]|nr:ABC transporter ATP-binding protein [Ignavibacteria bacterium]HQY51632.1 ABC transporter ATP-binding protein [Ignavibacteria bacterium]
MKFSINNLSKSYERSHKALDNINIEIGQGMFGLLGPNGAGKSTLMRIAATVQLPDEGEIYFDEINVLEDPMSYRKLLGYLPQEFGIYQGMNADELLDYFAILKGISSSRDRKMITDKVLEMTNLLDVRKMHVSKYSGGMKQRFGIAQILLNDPKIIIVDEPTSGLDPAERKRFLNLLREIASTNIIIFSTHIVDDIKDLCNDMAIINKGRILKTGSPTAAVKELDQKIWVINIDKNELEEYTRLHRVISSKFNEDNSLSVKVYSEEKPSAEFIDADPDLEDIYFTVLENDKHTVS